MDILDLLPSQEDTKKIKWEYTENPESYKNHTQYIDIIVVHFEDVHKDDIEDIQDIQDIEEVHKDDIQDVKEVHEDDVKDVKMKCLSDPERFLWTP
jgi:hypothetical protein